MSYQHVETVEGEEHSMWCADTMQICPPEDNGPVICTELADVQSRENETLVTEFKDVFSGKPGQTNLTEHSINNMTANPVGQLPYRLPYAHRDLVKQMIDLMLKDGVIEPSTSDWASPIVLC